MQIRFKPIRGIDEVQEFIKQVPRGTTKIAIEETTKYIIGDSSHGLAHDEQYQQTTREAVYGQQWESDAQRGYVMARIRSGEIQLGQRQKSPTEQSTSYGYQLTNDGYGATITNSSEGAYWTRIWGGWKNWRPFGQVVTDNLRGAMRHTVAEINKYLRKIGKG